MAWKCDDCNMKFEDLSLFETHKKKFCVCGKVGDPSELHRKASERNLGASRHVVSWLVVAWCYDVLLGKRVFNSVFCK